MNKHSDFTLNLSDTIKQAMTDEKKRLDFSLSDPLF